MYTVLGFPRRLVVVRKPILIGLYLGLPRAMRIGVFSLNPHGPVPDKRAKPVKLEWFDTTYRN